MFSWFEKKPKEPKPESPHLYWDRVLNKLMDKPKKVELGKCTIKIDGITIWIANFPYKFGFDSNDGAEFQPEPETKHRLIHFVMKHRYKGVMDNV